MTENDGFSTNTVAATEWGAALLFPFELVAIWLVKVTIHFVELLDGRVELCYIRARLGGMRGDGLLLMLLLLLLLLPLLVPALVLEMQFTHLLLMQLSFMILLLGLLALAFA